LKIDPNAAVITEREKQEEAASTLRQSIASTLSGTGAAVGRRVARVRGLRLVKDEPRLKPFIAWVSQILRSHLVAGDRLILEGTQGFGLSVLHSCDYPYVTSRDTTAAAFVSEAGLSPLDVDEVILVLRAFPIRVGGNSGRLPNETDWKTIALASGCREDLVECTSVTKTIRRVARFDLEIVRQAILVNRPTAFVEDVQRNLRGFISYFGFGPSSLVAREKR
jgi:adenylosuccinate synthase